MDRIRHGGSGVVEQGVERWVGLVAVTLQCGIVASFDFVTRLATGEHPIGVGKRMLADTRIDVVYVFFAMDAVVHGLLFFDHFDGSGNGVVQSCSILASCSGIGRLSAAATLNLFAGGTDDGSSVLASIDQLLSQTDEQ